MKATRCSSRAFILSSHDSHDPNMLLTRNCEDCACAVSNDSRTENGISLFHPISIDTSLRYQSQKLYEEPLNADFCILFAPLGRGGVVVVNKSAHQILRCFQQPANLADVLNDWPGPYDDFAAAVQRLIELQLIHPAGQSPQPSFHSSTALTAWLHVTNACNLRCPYCYLNKSNESMDEATGRAAVEAIFRSAVANGFHTVKLKYAGGEAALNYPLVFKMHDYALELVGQLGLELQSVLLSNGVSFSSKLIAALKERGIRVMISLDGIGDAHNVQRPLLNGQLSFHLVEQTIKRLIEAELSPHLSITLTSRNLSSLPQTVRYALEHHLTFSLNFFRDNECTAGFTNLKYEEQPIIQAMLKAFAVIEEHMPPWSVLGALLDRGQLLQPRKRPCGVGQDYFVVSQRGRIAQCHMKIEETLGDIFQHDPLLLVRQDPVGIQNLSIEEKEGCRDCTWRYWCSGGCPIVTFRAAGRYDVKSPNCNIYQAIYPQALRLEGLRILKYAHNSDRTVEEAVI